MDTQPALKLQTNGRSRQTAGAESVLVRLLFTPGSDTLEQTHAFLTAYMAERLRPATAQRLLVAAYELFLNAMDYATHGSEIALEVVEGRDFASVRVSNETIAARTSMLRDQIAKIKVDAEAAFVGELRRPLTGGVARPMLGLARIAHESRLELDLVVNDKSVTVVATCKR